MKFCLSSVQFVAENSQKHVPPLLFIFHQSFAVYLDDFCFSFGH